MRCAEEKDTEGDVSRLVRHVLFCMKKPAIAAGFSCSLSLGGREVYAASYTHSVTTPST